MAPTFPAVDSATLKALRNGDTSALEKIHRAVYAAVVAEASKFGGDASLGPPVAGLAMLLIWEGRGHIETDEEFEQALHSAVRGSVLREQRRRAANKGGDAAKGGTTVDAVWSYVATEIAKGPATPAPRHAEGKRPVAKKAGSDGGRGAMIVIALLLLAGAGVGGYYVMQSGDHGVAEASYTLPDAKNVAVTPGQRGNLPLGPGDTAAIGSDTKIVEGGDYGTKVRAVRVDGSASFRVSNGVHFEVDAKQVAIGTAGGAFAVSAYKDDPLTIVRVKDGEAKVDAGKQTRTLSAGQSVAVAADGTMSDPTPQAVDQALGWTDGHVAFTNAPLKDVMVGYARWYDLPVTTKDSSLLTRTVTLSVALESKKDAITALEDSAHVKFTYDKDARPMLEDAPAKPAGKAGAKAPAKAAAKPAAGKKKGA